MVEAGRQLVDTLRVVSAGGKMVDMNDALLRESIDVIGEHRGARATCISSVPGLPLQSARLSAVSTVALQPDDAL